MMLTDLTPWNPVPSGKDQFPLDFIQKQGVLILRKKDRELTMGLLENTPLNRLKMQNHFTGRELIFHTLDKRAFSIFLANRYSLNASILSTERKQATDLEVLEGDAPVINLVNSLIMEALNERASDIHIEAFPSSVSVRIRIDGVLKQAKIIAREHFEALSSRIKIMANLNIMEHRLPQDGRISVSTGGESVDMRVSVVPISGKGESIVLRLLNRSAGISSLEEMGFLPEQQREIRNLIRHPHGLILITGPTGSGKTTTLNGILKELNSPEKKIITIEDPVEFILPGINQIQTNSAIDLTFSVLLRRVLRQDPNIIMVGEIRDSETAELAVRAALTGHLVLSTLHTADAVTAPSRLEEMGVKPFLLAAVLRGVIAQRLVRLLCVNCRLERIPKPEESALWNTLKLRPPEKIWVPAGCGYCGKTGYKGRTVLAEIFSPDLYSQELISRGRGTAILKNHLASHDWTTLLMRGLQCTSRGDTSLNEVRGAVHLP